jgi:hypothetical protein
LFSIMGITDGIAHIRQIASRPWMAVNAQTRLSSWPGPFPGSNAIHMDVLLTENTYGLTMAHHIWRSFPIFTERIKSEPTGMLHVSL